MWQTKEEPIDILQVPYQHLASMLIQAAARARTVAARGAKQVNSMLKEVDTQETNASTKGVGEEELNAISTIRCGGGYAKMELSKFDAIENIVCELLK